MSARALMAKRKGEAKPAAPKRKRAPVESDDASDGEASETTTVTAKKGSRQVSTAQRTNKQATASSTTRATTSASSSAKPKRPDS